MPFGFGRGRRGRGFRGQRGPHRFDGGRAPSHCICPRCRLVIARKRGVPCFKTICPECGTAMARKFETES